MKNERIINSFDMITPDNNELTRILSRTMEKASRTNRTPFFSSIAVLIAGLLMLFTIGAFTYVTVADMPRLYSNETELVPLADTDTFTAIIIENYLSEYFDGFIIDHRDRNANIEGFFSNAETLLEKFDGEIISPVYAHYALDCTNSDIQIDPDIPIDRQHSFTTENYTVLDGLNHPVGASAGDMALSCGICIPQYKGDNNDGGASIPIAYFMTFPTDKVSDAAYTMIHGNLLTFGELYENEVFRNDEIICFDITDYIYDDLEEYVKTMTAERKDVYFDDAVWTRLKNARDFFREIARDQSRWYDPSRRN